MNLFVSVPEGGSATIPHGWKYTMSNPDYNGDYADPFNCMVSGGVIWFPSQ